MLYSPRLKRILETILKIGENEYIPVDQLAASLKTSRRTIFRELENVNDLLQPSGLLLESRPGKGLRLQGSASQKEALAEALRVEDISYINKEERRRLLAFELLRTRQIRKLVYYANMFQVSEATISHDIDALASAFEKNSITIHRAAKNRIELLGSETDRRTMMMRIVHDEMPELASVKSQDLYAGNLEQIFLGGAPEGIMSLLNQGILKRVLAVFSANAHELSLDRFSQPSYIGLILHLVIAIERIQNHEAIQAGSSVTTLIENKTSLQEAKAIADLMETEFDIEIPEVETAFIAMHLEGSKLNSPQNVNLKQQDARLQEIADAFIAGYSPAIQLQLREDEQFLQGLLTHLEPALIRMQNHLPIYNPLLPQLKEQYGALFEATRKAADALQNQYPFQISDEEAGFITMHVGASLERMASSGQTRTIRVGIVCASGIGVSALLAARVQKQFGSRIRVQTLSMEDLKSENLGLSELLLSTFPLSLPAMESIQVSPLLSAQDIERIESRLKTLSRTQPAAKESAVSYPQKLDLLADLITAQKSLLEGFVLYPTKPAKTKTDLLRQAAELLNGDSQILFEDLQAREALGAVSSKDEGFALFHASSQAVQTPQILFLYPPKGAKDFGSVPGFEGIEMIAAAIIPQHPTPQQRAMSSLLFSSFIERPGFLHAARAGNETNIRNHLDALFQQALEKSIQP